MSTSKHIDKICIAAVCLTLVLTILFMCGGTLGIAAAAKTMKYESTLFDTSYVHKIDIVMDDWDSFIETCENEEYASCTVVIDGNSHKNTAIRAKGNTSLSSVRSMDSQRYSFKLEFDHYEDGKSCDGLDKLCLNNLIQDNTMMKDYIAYTLMNDFGADSPLCSFAYITVNGEDWGLYLAVEGIEDSFLTRNYGTDTGELYKPDSMSFGGGRGNGKDFNMDDFDFDGQSKAETDSGQQSGSTSQMPNGGDDQQGGFPQMPNGDDSRQGGMPQMPKNGEMPNFGQMPQGGFSGDIPSMPNGSGGENTSQGGSFEMPEGFNPGEMTPGQDGGFGGMGSSDVKLQYIDDDPDSYANIFDSAKTDVSKSDKKRLISSLKNLSEYTDLENTLDIDEVLRYFVVHNFVVNGDSYTGNMIHNYYLHEKDGKLGMIPWDYNLAFGTFQGGSAASSVNDSVDEVLSDRPMQAWIFSDEAYTEQYHTLYAEFIEKWFGNGELERLIADTAELIRPYVEKDPTKFCTAEEFDTGVQTMRQFVTLRAEAVSRQLEGDTTTVETGDLNLSDMGSMGGGFDGGKNRDFDFSAMSGEQRGGKSSRTDSEVSDDNTADTSVDLPTQEENAEERPAGGFDPSTFEQSNRQGSSRPEGDMNFNPREGAAPDTPSASSDAAKWISVGVSFAVLAAGLCIAVKKKY
jgi:spore coat protein CotH